MRARLLGLTSLVLVPALLAACTGSKAKDTPSPEPSSPSTSPTPDALSELSRLAGLGEQLSYSAVYDVTGKTPGQSRLVRTPTAYRFELTTGSRKTRRQAVLIGTSSGTVSCTTLPGPATCFTVAGPGQPVPATFDAGLQHVFSDYLTLLASETSNYTVTASTPKPGDFACFDVALAASPAPAKVVASGTYCFTETGAVSRVVYPSGNAATLQRMGAAPRGADFNPPVKPQPLPK